VIKNLKELLDYMEKDAQQFEDPKIRDTFQIKAQGSESEKIIQLEHVLGKIPPKYRALLENYNFLNVSIGYFSLAPLDYKQDFINDLMFANLEEPFLSKDLLQKKNLLWVGSNNDYTVYVSKGYEEFKEDEIILIDEEIIGNEDNPRPEDIRPIAKDFEQFLIAAGNLNEIHREIKEDNSNWEEKKNEFIERLKILGVAEKYHKTWLSVF